MNRTLFTPSNFKRHLSEIAKGLGIISTLCLLGVTGLLGTVWADNSQNDFRLNGRAVPVTLASVNGVDLPSSYLESQLETYRLMNRRQGNTASAKEEELFARQTVDQMVDQELIYQETRKTKIRVASKTIENEIEKIREQFPSADMYQTALKIQGLTPAMVRANLEKQMAEDEWIRRIIVPEVNVGDPEVESYYQKHADQFKTPATYDVAHIFVASLAPDPEELPQEPGLRHKAQRLQKLLDQDALKKAEMVLRRLKAGEEFASLAREFSEDEGSREKGGELGSVTAEDLPPKVVAALKPLRPGHPSEILRSAYGYHILKLNKINPAGVVELDQVKTEILNLLLKQKVMEVRTSHLEKLRSQADIRLFF